MVIFRTYDVENPACEDPASPVLLIQGPEPFRPLGQCGHCSHLERLEHARIHLALHFQYLRNDFSVRRHHADTPAGHVVRLAERIQLQTAVLRSRHGQDGKRMIVQDETVRVVIAYQYAVPAAEIHQFPIQFHGSGSSRRHVRIIRPHDLHSGQIHLLERIEIRLPSVAGLQIIRNQTGFGEGCSR